jgi:hypothetical protein
MNEVRELLESLLTHEGWMTHGKCRGANPDRYLSDKLPPFPPAAREARLEELCGGCPVRRQCAGYALRVELTQVIVCGIPLTAHPDKAQKDALRAIKDGKKP